MICSNFTKHVYDSDGTFGTQIQKVTWRESLTRWLMAGLLAVFSVWIPAVHAVDFQGCVFLDQNSNGTYDAGELVQANAVVYLMDNKLVQTGQGGFFTAVTGGDGCYYFWGNNASDFTIWIDIPPDMRQVTPVAGEVGQPAFYDLTVTKASQTVKVNFGLAGTTPTEIWSMRDDGVMVSNSDYDMLVKPNKDATEKTEMQVNQVGDTYQGDNKATQVYVSPNDGTRSRRSSANEFSILVGKNVSETGEEIALDARVNPDNSVSFTDPTYPTVAVTAHPDGTYTGIDSESPTVNVAFDPVGNITATDSEDPTMSLLIDKATGKVTVTDSEYPMTTAGINPDGSYTITDEEFPNLIATVYANNEYVVQDILNNMVARIDSQGNYMVIDNENGVCVVLPNTRGLWDDIVGFGRNILNGIKDFFSSVTRFISKIAGFVANVARFVVKVAQVISVVARVVATIARVAAVLFPPLCPLFCAVASFAEGVARISDMVGNFASRVATIAERIQQGGLGSFWVGGGVKSCPVGSSLNDGVYSCSRPTMIIANHNYVTHVVGGVTVETIGRSQSIGSGGSNTNDGKDLGPEEGGVCKLVIAEEHPKKDAFLDSIRQCANHGVWIPFINDCYNAVENAAKRVGLTGVDISPPCPRIGPCECP